MDNLDETSKKISNNDFISHVFNFDNTTKSELLNIGQYSLISLVPIVLLNKLTRKYIPESDDTKGSLEVFLEVVFQIFIMYFGLYLIHRFVTFFPTYSGEPYEPFILTNIILATLVIILSLQTRLGEKVNILYTRAQNFVLGEESIKENMKNKEKESKKDNIIPNQAPGNFPNPEKLVLKNEAQPNAMTYNQNGDNYNGGTTIESFHQPDLMAANEALGGSFGSMF